MLRFPLPVSVRPAALGAVLVIALCGAVGRLAYVDGPPAGYTGGFGEPSCLACHFDNPVNDKEGSVAISGFPDRYLQGETYSVTLKVRRPGARRAGFQAAARYTSGPRVGQTAGTLRPRGKRVERLVTDSVTYLQHSPQGSFVHDTHGEWTMEWTAPSEAHGEVAFHAAANAGNDDNSVFGDYIFLVEAVSLPDD